MNAKQIIPMLVMLVLVALPAFAQPANGVRKGAPGPVKEGAFPRGRKGMGEWGRGKEIVVAMGKLKKENFEEFKRLDDLRKNDLEKFLVEIKKYLPKRTNDFRKMAQMERACRELAHKIANTEDKDEKAKLEALLKAKLKECFDVMISDATERIARMSQQLKEMKDNEEYILSERFADLTDVNKSMQPPLPPPAPKE